MSEPNDETWRAIAVAAYNAYGSVVDFKNQQGQPMPSFDQLPSTIQSAWERAARTVSECLQNPELIAAANTQTGQQIVDAALQNLRGETP